MIEAFSASFPFQIIGRILLFLTLLFHPIS